MKVLLINVTCGTGSTGVIAVEIATRLESLGHEAYIAYGQGVSTYHKSYKIGGILENKVHALWHTRVCGREGFGTRRGTKRFIRWIEQLQPDVVQILNLHSNFLHFPMLFTYLKNKKIPVVYALYDCWPFTGKCTHFTEPSCRKWETRCGDCPRLQSGPSTWFFDRTASLYDIKKDLFTSLSNMQVVVCSNWLKSEVEKSFLSKWPIHMIYNWIDTNKFKELHDETIYERYKIDKKKKILISVSAFWDDNTTRFNDATRLADVLPKDYQLVLVGKKITKKTLPENIVQIDYVKGVTELSKLYSEAIAFVGFSVEDTFGKVFAESMLCGTPAIVFNSTACPEVVGDTGYVVPPHDVNAMIDCIKEISLNGREYYSQRCKDLVLSKYGYEQNVDKYIDIYRSIITCK